MQPLSPNLKKDLESNASEVAQAVQTLDDNVQILRRVFPLGCKVQFPRPAEWMPGPEVVTGTVTGYQRETGNLVVRVHGLRATNAGGVHRVSPTEITQYETL